MENGIGFDRDSLSDDELALAVTNACRLLGHSDDATIRSIVIVGGRRLTGAELLRVADVAAAAGVRLVMDGNGVVTLRRAVTIVISEPPRHWRRWRRRRRRDHTVIAGQERDSDCV